MRKHKVTNEKTEKKYNYQTARYFTELLMITRSQRAPTSSWQLFALWASLDGEETVKYKLICDGWTRAEEEELSFYRTQVYLRA